MLSAENAGAVGAGLQSLEVRNPSRVCGGRWCTGKDDYLKRQWLSCRDSEPYPVPVLSGGFLALGRDLFAEIGGFDEGMWMYGVEDTAISVRLWTFSHEWPAAPRILIAHRFTRPGRSSPCD
jgi:GT2 family glycosyltransferase